MQEINKSLCWYGFNKPFNAIRIFFSSFFFIVSMSKKVLTNSVPNKTEIGSVTCVGFWMKKSLTPFLVNLNIIQQILNMYLVFIFVLFLFLCVNIFLNNTNKLKCVLKSVTHHSVVQRVTAHLNETLVSPGTFGQNILLHRTPVRSKK